MGSFEEEIDINDRYEGQPVAFFDVFKNGDKGSAQYFFLDMYVSLLSEYLKLDRDLEKGLVVAFFLRQFVKEEIHSNTVGPAVASEQRTFRTAELERKLLIPRETLRRKLCSLVRQGFLEKTDSDGWKIRIQDGKPVVTLSAPHVVEKQMLAFSKLMTRAATPPVG